MEPFWARGTRPSGALELAVLGTAPRLTRLFRHAPLSQKGLHRRIIDQVCRWVPSRSASSDSSERQANLGHARFAFAQVRRSARGCPSRGRRSRASRCKGCARRRRRARCPARATASARPPRARRCTRRPRADAAVEAVEQLVQVVRAERMLYGGLVRRASSCGSFERSAGDASSRSRARAASDRPRGRARRRRGRSRSPAASPRVIGPGRQLVARLGARARDLVRDREGALPGPARARAGRGGEHRVGNCCATW